MCGDTRSLIHGIINLIVPFFIYDLASLLVGAITAANYNPWLAFWPMTILLWLPFVSDAVCVVVACRALPASGPYPRAAGTDLLRGRSGAILYAALPAAFHAVPAERYVLTGRRTPMRPDFIPVGAVVNAHGIRGEVKVNPAGFDPEFIASFKTLYIGGQPVKVISARVHKSTVLLALPGVATMDDALALKGKTVSIRRTDAKLPKGQYFDAELEGCTVLDDATGEELGKLDKVLHYPAHKVYQVRGGAHEYLIPAVPGVFIASADPDAGIIRVHMMKGLATDEN